MFKPDGSGANQCVRGLRLMAARLQQAGVDFRFVAPRLFAATPEIIRTLYTEHAGKGWFEKKHIPFMTGRHLDPLVKQAPLFSAIIEADARVGDLYKILRQDHVIGPINPEKALLELEADDARTAAIMQSIRYLLTMGSGARIYLLHRQPDTPMANRVHGSADAANAALEMLACYGTVQELSDFYSEGAFSRLLAEWNTHGVSAPPASPGLPLWRGFEEAQAPEFMRQLADAGFVYRDFGEGELRRLIYEFNQLTPLLVGLDANFAAAANQPPALELTTPPAKPAAVLIGISGLPSSGKSTIASEVRARLGLGSVIHVTSNRAEAEARTGGDEYLYLPEPAFMEKLAQGELTGVSQFREWQKYYSVLTSSLEELALRGGSAVLVCGANTLAAVREYLKGSNVTFRTIFISPPTIAETRTRQVFRGRAGDEARLEKLETVGARILTRAGEFDLRIVNDDLERATAQAVEYVRCTIAGETSETAAPPEVRIATPRQVVIEYLWRGFVKRLEDTRAQVKTGSLAELQQSVKDLYEAQLAAFFAEVRGETKGRAHLSKGDDAVVKDVTGHTLEVQTSNLLTTQPPAMITQTTDSLGRLAADGPPERVEPNLAGIRELAETFSPLERDVIAILHDLGKLIANLNHNLHSAELIDRYQLLDGVAGITADRKTIIKLAIKHHFAIGDLTCGVFSLVGTRNMFADPEVRAALTNPDRSVAADRMKTFLACLTFLTVIDIAGRPGKRGLRNLLVETYNKWHGRLAALAAEHQGSYDEFLAALVKEAPQYNVERISGKLVAADPLMDRRTEGWAYYDEIVTRSIARAVETGVISPADRDLLLTNLQFITDEWYTALGYLARIKDGRILDDIPTEMNFTVLKSMVLYLRLARQYIPGFGPDRNVIFGLTDARGNMLASIPRVKAAAVELDRLFAQAEGFVEEGEEIFLTDRAGKKIDDLSFTLSDDKTTTTNVLLTSHFKNI